MEPPPEPSSWMSTKMPWCCMRFRLPRLHHHAQRAPARRCWSSWPRGRYSAPDPFDFSSTPTRASSRRTWAPRCASRRCSCQTVDTAEGGKSSSYAGMSPAPRPVKMACAGVPRSRRAWHLPLPDGGRNSAWRHGRSGRTRPAASVHDGRSTCPGLSPAFPPWPASCPRPASDASLAPAFIPDPGSCWSTNCRWDSPPSSSWSCLGRRRLRNECLGRLVGSHRAAFRWPTCRLPEKGNPFPARSGDSRTLRSGAGFLSAPGPRAVARPQRRRGQTFRTFDIASLVTPARRGPRSGPGHTRSAGHPSTTATCIEPGEIVG